MQSSHDYLLRLNDVLARIPVSRSTWYDGIKAGRFPPSVPLGGRSVAWRSSDISKIIERGVLQ